MEYKDCHILRLLGIPEDRLHKSAVICGSKSRFKVFAELSSKFREFGEFRCYNAAELEVDGEMILLVCHGTSASSMALVVREMLEMGVKCIIRCGTCATFKPKLISPTGGGCIVYASYRDEIVTYSEVHPAYPSVADYDVIEALVETSNELNYPLPLGITFSTDYMFITKEIPDRLEKIVKMGTSETKDQETGALFVLASLYGGKAGAILTADGTTFAITMDDYMSDRSRIDKGVRHAVEIALKSAAKLNKRF